MSFKVIITRIADGKSVEITDNDSWDEGSEFRWNEGNQACDCNRRLDFARAFKEPEPDINPCGEGAFTVILPPVTW
jgi:hypothetical protein